MKKILLISCALMFCSAQAQAEDVKRVFDIEVDGKMFTYGPSRAHLKNPEKSWWTCQWGGLWRSDTAHGMHRVTDVQGRGIPCEIVEYRK